MFNLKAAVNGFMLCAHIHLPDHDVCLTSNFLI